jgi:hydroxymethylglutaryl-CoA reductase (NADPH)
MAIPVYHANAYLHRLLKERSQDELIESLRPKPEVETVPKIPRDHRISSNLVERRWGLFPDKTSAKAQLLDSVTAEGMDTYERNIENFIGTVRIPVGIAGPLRVNGLFAQGDFHVPLATTEAALVASYSRGAQLITRAGGATAMLLSEGVSRAPGFAFENLRGVATFAAWAVGEIDNFKREAAKTTRHGRYADLRRG